MAPQILRDARSFLLSEGPTETLLMYLGSKVIHAHQDLERFIAVRLCAPRVAARLLDITERIRARCSKHSLPTGIVEPGNSYWVSALVGEIAMWAILVAAVEHRKGHELASTWARSKYEERIESLTEADSAEWALAPN